MYGCIMQRVILAAKNIKVNEINFQIQNKMAGELMTYKQLIPLLTKMTTQRSF